MDKTQFKERLDLEALERMQTEDPILVYKKTIKAKLGVIVYNPVTNTPEERILEGDPNNAKTNIDDITVKIWTKSAQMYFENMNQRLIAEGLLVPHSGQSKPDINMVNAISDEEIEQILNEKYFTLMNKLAEFTSSVPVSRVLIKAKEMNKPTKTVERIQERLEELQAEEGLDNRAGNLEVYYKNLEG